MYICVQVFVCVHMYTLTVCIYIYVYIYTYIHIRIHIHVRIKHRRTHQIVCYSACIRCKEGSFLSRPLAGSNLQSNGIHSIPIP